MNYNIPEHLKGLSKAEVEESHAQHGFNVMKAASTNSKLDILLDILKEPMVILLLIITLIYLISGNYGDAIFMFVAIVAVSGISFYQDNRSKKALKELEKLNEPLSKVIRNSEIIKIPTHEIAVGDLCVTEEGKMINADGIIVYSNDFSVNESALTGESYSVFKDNQSDDSKVYSGTLTVSGFAVFNVEQIGNETKIGKIGTSILNVKEEKSPLQIQIGQFVRSMAIVGIVIFLMVWGYRYYESHDFTKSLLNGLTLAMSILPEEIPVAFTTFMALGAWKLMREGIIIKRSNIVETLGSTTVICTDKTGTITENSMKLQAIYDLRTGQIFYDDEFADKRLAEVISYSMWSSEPVPFDPMEKALHQAYEETHEKDLRKEYSLVHEYPLAGKPPMMTHIYENAKGHRIVAAKGAPEAILEVSRLTESQKNDLKSLISDFGKKGFRILGVAAAEIDGNHFPKEQQDIPFDFLGMVVFNDPPKEGIKEVFHHIYEAGIKVKVITGDNADTTKAVAQKAGIYNDSPPVNGAEIASKSEKELMDISDHTTLFTRMFPEAKLALVNALKRKGEVVAMIGDGVNDGPGLKAAHIGVAMGLKGTEIAKAAAALIITNDDLGKLIKGIADGRRIYSNIKKAIQYIISIHIPIILTVSVPLFLGWIYPQIFSPVHVIFLELVMGPTCSIVYENEPMEENTMRQKPRPMTDTFLNWRELAISMAQGILITIGVLFTYQLAAHQGGNEEKTRAMVFSTLIFANVFLSYVNRSFYYSVIHSFRKKNSLLASITVLVIGLLLVILYVPSVSRFFSVTSLNETEISISIGTAMVSVLWFEIFKWIKRKRSSGEIES